MRYRLELWVHNIVRWNRILQSCLQWEISLIRVWLGDVQREFLDVERNEQRG